MGFRDDVALRVRPDGDGARIDVRSASRYGRHDFGTNAARIRSLLEDIDDRLERRSRAGRARRRSAAAQRKRSRTHVQTASSNAAESRGSSSRYVEAIAKR